MAEAPAESASKLADAFRMAAAAGDAASLKRLLAQGADVNSTAELGETALILACWNGHLEAARVLVDAGADKDAFSNMYFTPLGTALVHGHAPVAEFLLARGADPNRKIDVDCAPIQLTASNSDEKMTRLLIQYKADVSVTDLGGITPLLQAVICKSLPVVRILHEEGGASLQAADGSGKTPLMMAATTKDDDCLDYLLAKGALVHAFDKGGGSPLAAAADAGNAYAVGEILKHGANINHLDANGMTPLMRAAQRGQIRSVAALIGHGADISPCTEQGSDARQLAAEKGHEEIVRLIDGEKRRQHHLSVDAAIAAGSGTPVKAMKRLKLRLGPI